MINTRGTYQAWKRSVLRQYPNALIETQREGRRIVAARATYDYRVVLSSWALVEPTVEKAD